MKILSYIQNALTGYYDTEELLPLSEWIAEEVLGISHTEFIIKRLNKQKLDVDKNKLDKWLSRLQSGEPWQYICGYTDFMGLRLKVDMSTLIPRPETAELVTWIIQDHRNTNTLSILDIGTGTGCIALQLKKHLTHAHVEGLDISEEALCIANENANAHDLRVQFRRQDVLQAQPTRKPLYDIIVSNPPYVCLNEMESMDKRVKDFEPQTALFVDDKDPLIFYRTIANLHWAKVLYFEINQKFGHETKELLQTLGYKVEVKKDAYNNDRMLKAEIAY